MKNKMGNLFIFLGAVMVLGALCLFLWNLWEDRQAGKTVEEILPQLAEIIQERVSGGGDNVDLSDSETVVELPDGYEYMGYLSLPSLGLELPVMSDLSYSQLKIAPCRYSGAVETDDLVIAAHNYSRHFGSIKDLSLEDTVYFTDVNGNIYIYEVRQIDLLSSASVEEMTSGDYALTLFTCTYDGQSRVTVRCERAE